MHSDESDIIKQRQIEFNELHPDPDQAGTAVQLLSDIEGVRAVTAENEILLNVRYDVLQITLEQIEDALNETGFHLSNKLIYKLRRALYYYTEEVQRANSGCPSVDVNCTRKVFVNRYQQLDHALQDPRPEHWRKYL